MDKIRKERIMLSESKSSQSLRVCHRCGHTWAGNESDLCPRCKSCRWMQGKMDRIFCPYCATMWHPKGQNENCHSCGKSPSLKGKERYTCVRCEYIWVKTGDSIPDKCPLCHTSSWIPESAVTHICNMCGHIWRNKIENPLRCPSCYSELWNVPCHRLQCKRCGHRWISRSATEGDASICPSCKSRFWQDPLPLFECTVCGKLFTAARGNPEKCTACTGKKTSFEQKCVLCGTKWSSNKKYGSCPKCGNSIERPEIKSNRVIWEKENNRLVLVTDLGVSTVYLVQDGKPVTAVNLPDVLNLLNRSQKEFLDNTTDAEMERVANRMYDRRNDYLKKVDYLQELLSLKRTDAVILGMHFDGMSPESIALRLEIPSKEVTDAFDRIMSAYKNAGITVNDSIYTTDPFSEYRKQMSR